tara:strand:+ start:812 stop:1051 length:240 start_codon:yes stop_codon:yes gene_type:complete
LYTCAVTPIYFYCVTLPHAFQELCQIAKLFIFNTLTIKSVKAPPHPLIIFSARAKAKNAKTENIAVAPLYTFEEESLSF